MRNKRRALSDAQRSRLSERLARVITTRLLLRRYKRIACYLPNDGEIDLTPLVERAWKVGRKIYLPVLHGSKLWFLPYTLSTPLTNNYFGIPEPDISVDKRCPAAAMDLVLVPLVAFDNNGHRLGMGGGFYDRTFGYKSKARSLRKPRLIGGCL